MMIICPERSIQRNRVQPQNVTSRAAPERSFQGSPGQLQSAASSLGIFSLVRFGNINMIHNITISITITFASSVTTSIHDNTSNGNTNNNTTRNSNFDTNCNIITPMNIARTNQN